MANKMIRWTGAGAKLSSITRGKASDDHHLLYCLLPDHIKLYVARAILRSCKTTHKKNHFCLYRILNEWHLSLMAMEGENAGSSARKRILRHAYDLSNGYGKGKGMSLDNMICFNKHKTNFPSAMQIANVANSVSSFFFFFSISHGCE